MGADDDVCFSPAQPAQGCGLLRLCPKPGQHIHCDGKSPKPAESRLIVLIGQNRGGNQDRHLISAADGLKGRPQRHLRFSVSHIPADDPVHGISCLHVPLYVCNSGELTVRFFVGEGGGKLSAHIVFRGKGDSFRSPTAGIQFDELMGHLLGRGTGPAFCPGPVSAAHFR